MIEIAENRKQNWGGGGQYTIFDEQLSVITKSNIVSPGDWNHSRLTS